MDKHMNRRRFLELTVGTGATLCDYWDVRPLTNSLKICKLCLQIVSL